MTGSTVHHLKQVVCLFGGIPTLAGAGQQQVGRHHATVKPMHRAAPTHAADHADVGAGNFGVNVCDEKFRKSERIWARSRALVVHSHSSPPLYGEGIVCSACDNPRKLNRSPRNYGCGCYHLPVESKFLGSNMRNMQMREVLQ